jgi:hypothetical protein
MKLWQSPWISIAVFLMRTIGKAGEARVSSFSIGR